MRINELNNMNEQINSNNFFGTLKIQNIKFGTLNKIDTLIVNNKIHLNSNNSNNSNNNNEFCKILFDIDKIY